MMILFIALCVFVVAFIAHLFLTQSSKDTLTQEVRSLKFAAEQTTKKAESLLGMIQDLDDSFKNLKAVFAELKKENDTMVVRQRSMEKKLTEQTKTVNINVNPAAMKGRGKGSLLEKAGVHI